MVHWASLARLSGGAVYFDSAKTIEQVSDRVVPFMAGVLVNRAGGSCHGQLALPWMRERSGIVDFEPIENRISVKQVEPFRNVKISVPSVETAGIPVEASAIVEVRRI